MQEMVSKENAMLLSVFLLFKFLSKDLIIAALTAYFIRGIVALSSVQIFFGELLQKYYTYYCICDLKTSCMFLCSATLLPSIMRFSTKEWSYKEVVSRNPLIHTVSVDLIKLRVVASIPGLVFCMWYAAKKHLANSVLGISSRIQHVKIEMLSLRSFKTGAILLVLFTSVMVRVAKSLYAPIKVMDLLRELSLLFPTADAAWPSSMLTLCDTGIFVALALRIAVPRGSKNSFFNCTFLRYTVSLAVTIIMNWFQAEQPAQLYIAPCVIGFVALHCLWNGGVKQQDGTNQLMGKVWDWNMYGTKLKKFDGCVVHTTIEDDDGGEGDATTLLGDCEGGPEYGDSGVDSYAAALENHNGGAEDDATALPGDCEGGPEDGDSGVDSDAAALEDHNGGGEDDATALPEDCECGPDDSCDEILMCTRRGVQVLALRANFPIFTIHGFDWQTIRCIYIRPEGEAQEEGMVDLVPIGPRRMFMAYTGFGLEVRGDEGPPINQGWDATDPEEDPEEYTKTIWVDPDRKLEVTYLVIPCALEINVEVRLKLNDLGSRTRAVCGNIKVRAPDYGNKSVHLFSCERWSKWSVPSGSTSVLPLSPSVIALPYSWQLEHHVDVDLTVITTCDNQEEDKHLKFSLEFARGIRSQEREFDDGQVEVITWHTLPL